MKYYPVLIPTLNRFTHFKNCVESLSCCTHADKTELVIGLDYPPSEKYEEGYLKIKKYIPTISGFAKVTVFEHDKNLGPDGNWRYLVNYCKQYYDAYIATEDDNVFAPAFLDYMDHALEMYQDDVEIVTVSGYNFPEAYDQGEYTYYKSKDNCAWGTGYWTYKEKELSKIINDSGYFKSVIFNKYKAKLIFETYPGLYRMLSVMVVFGHRWGDVMRTTINIINGKYQVRPAISMVRNMGFDGSGLRVKSLNSEFSQQKLYESEIFDFKSGIGPFDTNINKVALYNHSFLEGMDSRQKRKRLSKLYRLYLINTNILLRLLLLPLWRLDIHTKFKNSLSLFRKFLFSYN